MDYWNRFRSRFSVVAILDELHREHCSLARVEGAAIVPFSPVRRATRPACGGHGWDIETQMVGVP
jgi:hypothetical protein